MKFHCPHCGQHYETDDQYDGFQTECMRCRKSFVITSINVGGEEISGSRQKRDTRRYALPPIAMLDKADNIYDESPEEIHDLQEAIEQTLASFKIPGIIARHLAGPRFIRFELSLKEGILLRKIRKLADNLAMRLSRPEVFILAPIPGRDVIGIDIPRRHFESLPFRSLLETDAWRNTKAEIPVALGAKITGEPVILDLAEASNLLVCGVSGTEKNDCLNTLISSILFRFPPDELRLLMIDLKITEFRCYQTLPHLIAPVVNSLEQVPSALNWAATEMEERYHIIAQAGLTTLAEYNNRENRTPVYDENGRPVPQKMPAVILLINELAELMMTSHRKEMESAICRLCHLGNSVGIHVILGTRHISARIITDAIKVNILTRLCFRFHSDEDSRMVLDQNGAERLLGKGDMLLLSPACLGPERIQGAAMENSKLEEVVKFVSDQVPQNFSARVMAGKEDMAEEIDDNAVDYGEDDYTDIAPVIRKYMRPGDNDDVRRALEVVVLDRKASTSYLQRRLKIGYNRAAEIMDLFEERGIVGAASGSGENREILIFDGMDE